MSYTPRGRGGAGYQGGYGGGNGGGDRRRQRDESRDEDSKRQRRDDSYGRGEGGHSSRGSDPHIRGGGDRGSRGGNGGGRGRRPRLPPDEFRAKMEKERQELKEQEIRSYDNVKTKPDNVENKLGRSGEPVQLLANYFKVKTTGDHLTLYNYRVDFDPEPEKTHDKRTLVRAHQSDLHGYIFDGSNLYSFLANLDSEKYSMSSTGQQVKITIKQVGTVEPGDSQYLQVYGIIVRTCLRLMGLDEIGRHFFERENTKQLANSRLEIWPGYSVALRCYDGGLLVNVDLRSKVLRLENCLEVIQSCGFNKPRIQSEIVGNVVITKYNRKTYKIHDIDWDKTPGSTFELGRGDQKQEKSFLDYYNEKYPGFRIRDMNQPLLISKPSRRDRHRGMSSNILLIPELCNITGLSEYQKSDFNLMRDIHSVTSLEPRRRHDQLMSFMGRLTSNLQVQGNLKEWGMSVNSNMVDVPGRILPPENMIMRNIRNDAEEKFQVEPNADWTNNFKGKMRMHNSIEMKNWAIIVGTENRSSVSRLLDALKFVANGLNFPINPNPEVIACPDTRRDASRAYVNGINEAVDKIKGLQMIFVILTNNSQDAYAAIKKRCNIEFGVRSQCFQSKHLAEQKQGGLKSVCTKVVIQMNAKLGGSPWVAVNPFKQSHTMVVGFDVHHSGKGKAKISIGAMVATTNNSFSQFFSTVSTHCNADNLSDNMCKDFTKCLMAFQQKNNELPDRVFMYRDGVGEGDLTYVNDHEVRQLLESIQGVYSGSNKILKFNFIIVTKKGNARLMRKFRGEVDNPQPGTCVDSVITMPERFDFFLISQQPRRGQTVSPTTYNVLRVEDKFPPDRLQILSHKFCHLYYNWTGTVSVPFVCQYAHKLSYLTGTTYREEGQYIHENLAHQLYFL